MTKEQYDVIVIGSGPGGSSPAPRCCRNAASNTLARREEQLPRRQDGERQEGRLRLRPLPARAGAHAPARLRDDLQRARRGRRVSPGLQPDDTRDVIKICYRRRDWKDYKLVSQAQAMADATPFFRLWEHQRRGAAEDHGDHDRDRDHAGGAARRARQRQHARVPVRAATRPTRCTATWPSTPTPRSPSPSIWWRPRSRFASSNRSCSRAAAASTRAASACSPTSCCASSRRTAATSSATTGSRRFSSRTAPSPAW